MKKQPYIWLDELSTKEAEKAASDGIVIIFPIGSVEEHGRHLPLCTDSIQSEYVAVEVAKKTGCLVAPAFRHGICNAGHNFSGTISIEFNTLYLLVRDVVSELVRNGFNRIILLTGHAGSSHMTALKLAAQNIIQKQTYINSKRKTRIMVLSDYDFADEYSVQLDFPKGDGHAGAIETSRIMAIRPDLVKAKGEPCFPQMPRFEVVSDPERYFPCGVMGDPTAASKKKGAEMNEYIVEQVTKLVAELQNE